MRSKTAVASYLVLFDRLSGRNKRYVERGIVLGLPSSLLVF